MAANIGRPAKLPDGPEALWDWMARRGLNQREAAKLLEISFVYLNEILHGDKTPGLAVAMKIERQAGIHPGIWLRTQVRESRQPLALVGRKR